MSRKNKSKNISHQSLKQPQPQNNIQTTPQVPEKTMPTQPRETNRPQNPVSIQPEEISLNAHKHIQSYLQQNNQTHLNQEELNAVLRLSQHLRIFGLLSAVGYINQTNDQEGKVRQRTVPVWSSLIKGFLELPSDTTRQNLMTRVVEIARNQPSEYLTKWRQSMIISNHWNFWARAYTEQE
jgi:hypothetical protein